MCVLWYCLCLQRIKPWPWYLSFTNYISEWFNQAQFGLPFSVLLHLVKIVWLNKFLLLCMLLFFLSCLNSSHCRLLLQTFAFLQSMWYRAITKLSPYVINVLPHFTLARKYTKDRFTQPSWTDVQDYLYTSIWNLFMKRWSQSSYIYWNNQLLFLYSLPSANWLTTANNFFVLSNVEC